VGQMTFRNESACACDGMYWGLLSMACVRVCRGVASHELDAGAEVALKRCVPH
jgi:hypothetical protein